MASIRDQQGRLDEQISYAEQATSFFEHAGFLVQAFETGILLERGLVGKGRLRDATESANKLLALAKRIDSPARIGQAEEAVGSTLFELEHYPGALEHFRQSLKLSLQVKENVPYEQLYCADTLARLGRYQDAEETLSSIAISDRGKPDIQVGVGKVESFMLESKRQFREAKVLAAQTLKTHPDMAPSERMELQAIVTESEVRTGDLKDAQADSEKLVDTSQKNGNSKLIARATFVRARTALEAGQYSKALQEAERALTYFEVQQEYESAWQTRAVLALVYDSQGEDDKAKTNAQKALDTLHSLEQDWDSVSVQGYTSRPDIQVTLHRLHKLV